MTVNHKVLNKNEAPEGYIAVLKSDVKSNALGNICRACDFRKICVDDDLLKDIENHRCMPDELQNGLKRKDGCSVVFKRQ